MILLAGLALVIASVPLTGGRLSRLADLKLQRSWTIALATAIQILIVDVVPEGIPQAVSAGLHLFSYAFALLFLLANGGVPGLGLIVVGGLMNLTAIATNDGMMPARAGALADAGLTTEAGFQNSGQVADASFWYFGDIFAWPDALPLSNVFSVGDVLLLLGLRAVLVGQCGSRLATSAPAVERRHRPWVRHGRHFRPRQTEWVGRRRRPQFAVGLSPSRAARRAGEQSP